jgi:hypothetical protein
MQAVAEDESHIRFYLDLDVAQATDDLPAFILAIDGGNTWNS